MKKIVLFIAIVLPLLMAACSEDKVGQIPTDSIPPKPIENVEVESMPGGAKITYSIPKETDISYVKGEYTVNGKIYVIRSSVYKNYMMMEGLGTSDPVELTLYTVDHSENLSQPITKTITPGTPLVKLIMESMTMQRDFGGVKVTWENVLSSEVGITVLATNDKGELEEGETLYTDMKNGEYSFRGYDDSERTFAVCLTDKWGNSSDTIKQVITPYFEKLLDKKSHKRLILPMDNSTQLGGNWGFMNMFDDKIGDSNGWHTTDGNKGKLPLYFTIDLGANAKLSRFKLWHRSGNNYYYKHFNIKTFEVWGAEDYKPNMDEEYWTNEWKNDWQQLGDFVTYKPSGMDGEVTNSDREYAANGFEFIIPLEARNIRYLRFVMKSNWSGGSDVHISELSFYGNDQLNN